ncbi:MAG: hypothetical protein R3208_03615 [Ketobacteraceae bacterium]|nr:hypothetical protein [Ketobacteraceae bacterium]
MELIAITTFLTFANITGVVAASEVLDRYEVEQEGVVIIEEMAHSEEPQSLLEAIQQKMNDK